MHAIIQNAQVVEFPILSIHQRFPNTSFPATITDADLPVGVVRVHPVAPPAYNQTTHKPVQATKPAFANGRWELGYSIVELDASELDERSQAMAQSVRADRDQRLAQCDWTQVADSPVDKAVWATYRQALRDITAQSGFPFEVLWPTIPA